MTDDEHLPAWADRLAAQDLSRTQCLEGYYNHNYRVEYAGRSYLLRIPIPNSDLMDLRRIAEASVLSYLEEIGLDAPRVIYQPASKTFSLHEWIEGETLNDLYPDQERVPDWVPRQIALKMSTLHQSDPEIFAETCRDLAMSPQTQDFFLAHYWFDRSVHKRLLPTMADTYRALGIPQDPFKGLDKLCLGIRERPFCLCHSDVHRKNILIRPVSKTLTLLDWELVLVGDPIYDIAVHFHKMRYEADQESLFIDSYITKSPSSLTAKSVREEIDLYLKLERVKSAIIDAYRVRGDLLSGKVQAKAATREVARYARKLEKAHTVWSTKASQTVVDPDEIHHILRC